jgi:hypothetical protein
MRMLLVRGEMAPEKLIHTDSDPVVANIKKKESVLLASRKLI